MYNQGHCGRMFTMKCIVSSSYVGAVIAQVEKKAIIIIIQIQQSDLRC